MGLHTADYFFDKGFALHAAGKLDEALAAYGKALEINPKDTGSLNNRGCVYEDKGLFDLAIADLCGVLRIKPSHTGALYNRGYVYDRKGLWDLAIQDFTGAIKQYKENDGPGINYNLAKTFNHRGNIYFKKQLWDLAMRDYTDAIGINPGYADALNNRGLVYAKKELFDLAIQDYTSAIGLNPGHADAFNNRGNVYYKKELWDLAMRDYTDAIGINPGYADAFNNRGNVYYKKELFDLAMRDYTSAIGLNPGHADAFNNRGNVYYKKELWDLAMRYYTSAIEINPKHTKALNNRGLVYAKKELWDLAIQDYTEAIMIDPGYVTALNNRGRAYLKKGLPHPALEDFTKHIEIEFPGEDPRRLIRIVRQEERQGGLDFTRGLMLEGFYADILGDSRNPVIIKPCFPSNRGVLFFDKLHTGKTIRRHLARFGGRYRLCFDTDFDAVLKRCVEIHGDAVLTPDFQRYFKELKNGGGQARPVSFSLYRDGKLAAGDLGLQIGRVYTSYSGYHEEPSAGTVQIILTARYLEEKGFAFWDFGPSDEFSYKTRLGAKVLSQEEYKAIFDTALETPALSVTRATSFNLAEQCMVKEIVAESSPEHFPSSAESFFGHGGLSQEVQGRFSQHIEIFRSVVRPCPARVFPKTHVQKPVQTVLD